MSMDVFSPQESSGVQERLALLDTLFAYGPLGFGFVDRHLRFARVNARLAVINGLPAEARLGHPVAEVLGAALWESRLPLFERAMAGEAVVDVTLAGRASGPAHGERRVLASYYPVLSDAEVMGVAVIVRDVTEQDGAEEALRASREEYRLLFEANPQPMWVYDLQTLDFLAVNAAAVRVYGYSPDEFLAMTLGDIRPAEDAPALAASVEAPRVGTRTDGPWRHLRKDGSGLWVEIAASGLDFGGWPARLITALDVTERVVMDGERAQMEGERREATARQQTFLRDIPASVTEGKLLLSNSSTPLAAPSGRHAGGPMKRRRMPRAANSPCVTARPARQRCSKSPWTASSPLTRKGRSSSSTPPPRRRSATRRRKPLAGPLRRRLSRPACVGSTTRGSPVISPRASVPFLGSGSR